MNIKCPHCDYEIELQDKGNAIFYCPECHEYYLLNQSKEHDLELIYAFAVWALGYEDGEKDGYRKGYDEGYNKALNKEKEEEE